MGGASVAACVGRFALVVLHYLWSCAVIHVEAKQNNMVSNVASMHCTLHRTTATGS